MKMDKQKIMNLFMLFVLFSISCYMPTVVTSEEIRHPRSSNNLRHGGGGPAGSCGQKTKSLRSQFRNPSFPETDTKERQCLYTVHIDKGVCAIRLDIDVFELAKFSNGGCLVDSMVVLGAPGKPSTPFCGNMTNWSTTFQVDVPSKAVLVATLSGTPPHRFSITVTQVLCNKIVPFASPIIGSMINSDAEEYEYYEPTDPPVTEAPTTQATDFDDDDDDLDEDNDEEKDDEETTTQDPELPTPLPTINLPARIPQDVILVVNSDFPEFKPDSNEHSNSESWFSESNFLFGTEEYTDYENPDGYVSDPVGAIPKISLYSKLLEKNKRERCLDKVVQEDELPHPTQEDELPRPTLYVVGGDNTNLNEYPWQVAIVSGKKFFCGGSLISSRHILTAAHCITGGANITRLRVSLGDHDLSTKNETNNTVRNVSRIYWHLQHNPITISHDIAILEMDRPVEFSRTINPIRLPTERINEQYEKKKTCYFKDMKKSYPIGSTGSYNCEEFICTESGMNKTGNNTPECEVATEKPGNGCWVELSEEVYTEGLTHYFKRCATWKCEDQKWQLIKDNCSDLFDDEPEVILTGWGRYSNEKTATSSVLKEYSAPLLDMENCIAKWNKTMPVSKEKHACLDISKGASCHGDSGGPLIKCSNSSCVQVGIVSFGHYACVDRGTPDVFTRVSHYTDWISMNLTPLSHLIYG